MSEQQQETSGDEQLGEHAAGAIGERLRDAAERDELAADDDDEQHGDDEQPEPAADEQPDPLLQAHAQYVAAVQSIMGADAEIVPCRHCAGMGFNALEFPPDTRRQQCPDCSGWGMVETGSRVQGQERLSCIGCNGAGWVPAVQAAPNAAAAPLTPVPVLPTFVPTPPAPAAATVD